MKRIGGYALLALAALPLSGAVIRGVVVEHQTGRVLSRTTVILQPVAGASEGRSVRTGSSGQFVFDALAPGVYVLKASRRGFMPMEYGQKQWNAAGRPVAVTADESPFLTIRLPRYPGITGTVVDENDVGLPDIEVVAYRATQPPVLVSRAASDDRGVYRIPGLTPGSYFVRSAAGRGDFTEYLPTFSRESLSVNEARLVQVYFDSDARDVDVRPVTGKLFTISGGVSPASLPVGPITVTLASDMGRQVRQGPFFQFRGLAPGQYEIYAEAEEDPAAGARFQSGYVRVMAREDTVVPLRLSPNETWFECAPEPRDGNLPQIMARRLDFAGTGPAVALKLHGNRAALALGRWEFMMLPPSGYYVSAVGGSLRAPGGRQRPDGWNETEIRGYSSLRFSLSAGPGSLEGIVKGGGEPVAGAPVYLEAYDPTYRKRLMDLRAVRSGMRGEYRFDGLAPGAYRVLSTFDYQDPAPEVMDAAPAAAVRIEANGNARADLALYEQR